jgi:hypothetical protein
MSYQQPIQDRREGSYSNGAQSSMYGQATAQARKPQSSQPQGVFYSQGAPQNSPGDNNMASLINAFSQTHLGVPSSTMPSTTSAMPVTASQYFYTADGQLVYAPAAGLYAAQTIAAPQLSDSNYGSFAAPVQYLPQATYPGYVHGYPMLPYTPGRSSFYQERSDNLQKGVPGLDNRRGSYSTTDESAPGTPFFGGMGLRDNGTHVTVLDRSPIYSTPSPQLQNHHIAQHVAKPLPYNRNNTVNADIDALLQQHPAIPAAVPAVFTPRENMRTLEQSLENRIPGNRNVYIRGLHPNTDDDTLSAYAARFGEVETSKAIIDTSTGACKGYVI